MPRQTDDIAEAAREIGADTADAAAFAKWYVKNQAWETDRAHDFVEPYNEFRRDREAIREEFVEPEDPFTAGAYHFGCDFKGEKQIAEYEDDKIFIPSSYYCEIKAVNKALGIEIPTIGISPFAMTLTAIRKMLKQYGKTAEDLPKHYRYDKDNDKFVQLNKNGKATTNAAIFALRIRGNDYHAILIKDRRYLDPRSPNHITFNYITERVRYETSKVLVNDWIRVKQYEPREFTSHVVIYDTETFSLERRDPRTDKLVRVPTPYGLGWTECEIGDKNYRFPEAREMQIIVDTDCMDLFMTAIANRWIEQNRVVERKMGKITRKEVNIFIYAHNGGGFDNIFVKKSTKIKMVREISKGSRIKELVIKLVEFKDINVYLHFRDSFNYVNIGLDSACKAFKIDTPKMKFDIVNKSRAWFDENNSITHQVDPARDWVEYLRYDVLSLAKIVHKFNTMIREKFGIDMPTSLGSPGFAYKLCLKNCSIMRDLYIAKHPTTQKFIRAAVHGGRVLHLKKSYTYSEEDGGLISLDANSLYPSAMQLGLYPIGLGKCYNVDEVSVEMLLESLTKGFPFIAEVEYKTTNHRYPIHPYKTDAGNLIYIDSPKDECLVDVFTSVDIEDMLHDGYEIVKVRRMIIWNRSARIFENLISKLYNHRADYKKADNPMEYVIKIVLNSLYGKMLEQVTDSKRFAEAPIQRGEVGWDDVIKCIGYQNGQFMIHEKLSNPLSNTPSHIGAFILAYSRRIMNDSIRRLRPENIWYGDTDSLYVTMKAFKESGILENSELGAFKNDYGDGSVIIEAIFIDLKRYYLKIRKANGEIKVKVKFNGLTFRDDSQPEWVYNWWESTFESKDEAIVDHIVVPQDRLELMKKSGESEEQIKKKLRTMIMREDGMRAMFIWFKENPDKVADINFVTEYWKRTDSSVEIFDRDMRFQVNPSRRGVWKNDEWFPFGYDETKPSKELSREILGVNKSDEHPTDHYLVGPRRFTSSTPIPCEEIDKMMTITNNGEYDISFDAYEGFYITEDNYLVRRLYGKKYTVDEYGIKQTTNTMAKPKHLVIAVPVKMEDGKPFPYQPCNKVLSRAELFDVRRQVENSLIKYQQRCNDCKDVLAKIDEAISENNEQDDLDLLDLL